VIYNSKITIRKHFRIHSVVTVGFMNMLSMLNGCCCCWILRILTMVYNTQNYWVSGLRPSSGILNTRKRNISGTDPVSETFFFLVFRIPEDRRSPETQQFWMLLFMEGEGRINYPLGLCAQFQFSISATIQKTTVWAFSLSGEQQAQPCSVWNCEPWQSIDLGQYYILGCNIM
jgi:hypothetical protein